TAYGGKVDKVVGDALVALFGAPVAHEDDAERAVRAALAMQRIVDDYSAETGVPVRLRVGVNTGEVLVGAMRAGDDYTAMGDVVNVASRLEERAEPGQVVVGASTRAAAPGIRYEPLGAVEIRGRGEAVEAFAALGAIAPPGYRPRRVRTPLVGRDAELGLLGSALASASRGRRPLLVLLTGEAGMGKSRLGEELAEMAIRDHDAAVYVGRCMPYGEANPWWPVTEILRQGFAIAPDEPAPDTREKLVRGVELATRTSGADARRIADALLHLTGMETTLGDVDPTRAVDEAISALAAVAEGLAREKLVVLFLADLNWAADVVLDLVDDLLDRLHGCRVVVVATARPELEDRWAPRLGRHNTVALHLDPLSSEATSELVEALLGRRDLPKGVGDTLMERSGGNPFFVEELVALLEETGALAGEAATGAELPATLRGLVAARLDSLTATARATVEDAAVLGRVGSVSALVELGGQRDDHDVAATLADLSARDLLVVEDGRFEFKSDLVREVAYETLTKSERARRHAAAATWLEQKARKTGREDEYLEQLAHHWRVAAELTVDVATPPADVPTDARARALEWLERAGERAEERESVDVAEQLYDDALGLLTADEVEHRHRLLLGRARARAWKRDLAAARVDLEEVLAGARERGDQHLEVRGLTVLGDVELRENDNEQALATLEQAMGIAGEVGDRQGRAEALRRWGMANLFLGRLDAAERAIGEALEGFRHLGDRRSEAWALQNLAWIAFNRGDTDLADKRLSESAATFEEISDWGGRSWARGLLGFVRLTQGRLEEAGELASEVIDEARRGGDRWALGMTLVLKASVALWLGRSTEARDRAQEAFEIFDSIDDDFGRGMALSNLVRASACLGRMPDLRRLYEQAFGAAQGVSESFRLTSQVLTANVFGQLGDARSALAATSDLDEISVEVPIEAWVARGLARVQAGQPDEALVDLERVLDAQPGDLRGPGDEGARTYALS
ncbi:MAG TPA: tetratricopeptide repeat protein, partial [Acidimicrobiia bacterium]|nr:tetratricopeptide repeat protein [Acidimicrobiia bacterium]